MSNQNDKPAYRPPRPRALPAIAALARTIAQGDGDLLSLLPAYAYREPVRFVGYSRRQILIVNDPALIRRVLVEEPDRFPKSDLMVGALEPLVGDSLFTSAGETWRRQRRLIDPAFSQLRLTAAYPAMTEAVGAYESDLAARAASGEAFSLDLAMSHLTADIICRTVFSASLASETAQRVFEDFMQFERTVAHVEIRRLIFDKAWTPAKQNPDVLAACRRIRTEIGALLDPHIAASGAENIAAAIANATEGETGRGFTREELIDQLGVFFLAGHETTASALTWAFYILASQPDIAARIRAEVAEAERAGPLDFEKVKRLGFVRCVFKEALRLYPPITFMPRVAAERCEIGGYKLRRGAMVMVAPWALHRHQDYWRRPDAFDPDRFAPDREAEIAPGAYIPFGMGPRICIGAGFASIEAALILSRLVKRFEFEVLDPEAVRPVARLTTRPRDQILCRVYERPPAAGA